MTADDILLQTEESMRKSVDHMHQEFSAIRTGKASPALVEGMEVEAYGGSRMKLKQLALISTPEPRLIVIQPFDASTTNDIERAIKESKLGINPAVDGKLIRLPVPELSEERRRDLVKSVKQMAEETRVSVRHSRREALDAGRKLHKSGDLTEDAMRDLEDDVQKLTDQHVGEIDSALEHKESEIMTI